MEDDNKPIPREDNFLQETETLEEMSAQPLLLFLKRALIALKDKQSEPSHQHIGTFKVPLPDESEIPLGITGSWSYGAESPRDVESVGLEKPRQTVCAIEMNVITPLASTSSLPSEFDFLRKTASAAGLQMTDIWDYAGDVSGKFTVHAEMSIRTREKVVYQDIRRILYFNEECLDMLLQEVNKQLDAMGYHEPSTPDTALKTSGVSHLLTQEQRRDREL